MAKNQIRKIYIPTCIVLEESEDCQLSNKGTWYYNRRFNKLITIFNCKFLKHRSLAYLWKQDFLLPFLFLLQSENAVKYLVSPIIYVWYRFCLHLKFTDVINYTLVYCTTSKYYVPCVCKRLLKNCLNLMQICQVHSSQTWTDVMETKLKLI